MMSISNPSHLLISRNSPRSPAHPQLAHASTSRHGHGHSHVVAPSPLLPSPSTAYPTPHPGPGLSDRIFGGWSHSADELTFPSHPHAHPHPHPHARSVSTPSTHANAYEDDPDGAHGVDEVVEVHPTFASDSTMPGRVKVIVGRNEFWCHKEVLWFASPFFQGLLQGSWAETNRIPSPYSYALEVSPSPEPRPEARPRLDANAAGPSYPSAPSSPPTDTDPPSPRHAGTPAPASPSAAFALGPVPVKPPINVCAAATSDDRGSGRQLHLADGPMETLPQEPSERDELVSDAERPLLVHTSDTEPSTGASTRRGSVYHDATADEPDHNLSLADILRELRELPETPSDGVRNIADVLEDGDHAPTLSEVLAGSARVGIVSSHVLESRTGAPLGHAGDRGTHPQEPSEGRAPAIATRYEGDHEAATPVQPSFSGQDELNMPPSSDSQPHRPQPSSRPTSILRLSRAKRNQAHPQARSTIRHSFSSSIAPPASNAGIRTAPEVAEVPEAVVELHEESASAFQDFLFWAYPHLECKVTWTNVENLLALSLKLIVPALQKLCEHFLMTHASGRPVMALSLAEEHGNAELYREASRFVLDQPTWDYIEMEALSDQTQLKLSKRRNWFLERLLKLGSIDVKKEYTCRADCPDPARCQAQLDEKWRQAHSAVCRYGPPQPSVAFRCLRQLETFPTNPSLAMSHPLCQNAAKTWVMSLFDRMFQPKLVFSNPGTEKYWLFITMN